MIILIRDASESILYFIKSGRPVIAIHTIPIHVAISNFPVAFYHTEKSLQNCHFLQKKNERIKLRIVSIVTSKKYIPLNELLPFFIS